MNFPHRFLAPPMMDEAALVVETGFTPAELDEMPQALIERILVYKGVKNVAVHGGTYNP